MTASTTLDLQTLNRSLAGKDPAQVIRWSADTFAGGLPMTSSFGAQAAVMLHLVTQEVPGIPVIWIDTGYLFEQTYHFAEQLRQRLNLNLKIYTPDITPARFEAMHGRAWEDPDQGQTQYLQTFKAKPMQRAIAELGVTAWLAGLRSDQTAHRAKLRRVELQDGIYKIHPILTWSNKDVHDYLKAHDLPYHPLVEQGYASIGDTHSTAPITAEMDERQGRFSGLRQECGLHLPASEEEIASRDSSGL